MQDKGEKARHVAETVEEKQRERDCARRNAQTAREREMKLDWPVFH